MPALFFSYSRNDADFVQRLAADLRAAGVVDLWVDQQDIAPGERWDRAVEEALKTARCLLVVLSPVSVASQNVLDEISYGLDRDKRIIPVLYRKCDIPFRLGRLQYIDFTGSYDKSLAQLIRSVGRGGSLATVIPSAAAAPSLETAAGVPTPAATLSGLGDAEERLPESSIRGLQQFVVGPFPAGRNDAPPPASPTPAALAEPAAAASMAAAPLPLVDPGELYRAGILARLEGDLPRTAALWQQILDRDAQFQHGMLVTQLESVRQQLIPVQKRQLREQAQNAQRAGAWVEEVSAWSSLLQIEADNKEAQARILVADENQKYAWIYDSARQFIKDGALSAARTQLEILREERPEYGDPEGLAQQAGFVAIRLRSASGRYDYETLNGRARNKDIEVEIVSQDLDGSITAYIGSRRVGPGPRYHCSGTVNNAAHIVLRGRHEQAAQEIVLEGDIEPGGRGEGRILIATGESTIQTGTWRIDSLLAPRARRLTVL